MNMFEEASSLFGMMKMCKSSQSEMAKKLGVSQSYVANKLRLLKLGEDEREKIISAGLTERHARALLRLTDKNTRLLALGKICDESLTVQRSEALVDFLFDSAAPERISKGERCDKIDSFKATLKKSTETLAALGVEITHSVSYYGKKTYITVSIEEG